MRMTVVIKCLEVENAWQSSNSGSIRIMPMDNFGYESDADWITRTLANVD